MNPTPRYRPGSDSTIIPGEWVTFPGAAAPGTLLGEVQCLECTSHRIIAHFLEKRKRPGLPAAALCSVMQREHPG